MNTLRTLSVLCMMVLTAACSEDSLPLVVDVPVTGRFVDAEVAGLGYECANDTTRRFTDEQGRFTCMVGQEVRFYIGELMLGSVIATPDLDVVTPVTLVGGEVDELIQIAAANLSIEPSVELVQGVFMAVVLQSLDEDGDPDNGIVIPESAHGLIDEPLVWEYDEGDPSGSLDEIFAALEDAEIDIVKVEGALFHMAEQSAKLLQGRYTGTVEIEDTVQVDLFVFTRLEKGKEALQVRMLTSDEDWSRPIRIDVFELFTGWEDNLLSAQYSLDQIVLTAYDVDAMMQDEVEINEDTVPADLTDYVLVVVPLEKTLTPPDVDLLDIAEFLETLPNGDEAPETMDGLYGPRVGIYATGEEPLEETAVQGLIIMPQEKWLSVEGHATKVGIEGFVDGHYVEAGHAMLASADENELVYRGRVLYGDLEGPKAPEANFDEPQDLTTWGDLVVTIDASGEATLSASGDDGSSLDSGAYEIVEAGVYDEPK